MNEKLHASAQLRSCNERRGSTASTWQAKQRSVATSSPKIVATACVKWWDMSNWDDREMA